jgi:hypothetical protein
VDRLRTPSGQRASPVAERCLCAARPKSERPFGSDLFRSAVALLFPVASIHTTGGAEMPSNTTNSTKKPATGERKFRGDSVTRSPSSGASSPLPSFGRPAQASPSRPSGSQRTARATPSSTTWSSGASSPASLAATSARVASSTSRVGFRGDSGRPPTAALDTPSRLSPAGSRRSLPGALRKLRQRDRSLPAFGEDLLLLEGRERDNR